MAGLTKEGLIIKKQSEVVEDLKDGAVPIFQDLVPPNDIVDTSDDSTLGRLIGLYSYPLADLWQAVQEVYWAFDPNSASGIALDNLVAYGGLSRIPATRSQVTVVVWGDVGTTIFPSINSVRSRDGNLYDVLDRVDLFSERNIGARFSIEEVEPSTTYSISVSTSNTTYTASYTTNNDDSEEDVAAELSQQLNNMTSIRSYPDGAEAVLETENIFEYISVSSVNTTLTKVKGRTEVVAQETGPISQKVGEVVNIATPLLGWDSVYNPFPAVEGRDTETDEELRVRFRESKYIRAQNISDSLYSVLMDLDGTKFVAVYENTGDTYLPEYDLPPHSFRVLVEGGSAEDIAQLIWTNKPLGIAPEGSEHVEIRDSQGYRQDIFFDRPQIKSVYIEINLTTDSDFVGDGADKIRAHLIDWFNNNLSIGDDVVYSRLYTPINMVGGHQVDRLFIGTSPNPTGTSNISVAYNEVATIDSSDITINI